MLVMDGVFTSDRLDAAFAALADPTRRGILAQLATGERTVSELVQPFELSQPAISRHLKVLEGAGLIVRSVDGNRRPSRLAPEALREIDGWLSMLRAALETNYVRLDDLLAELTADGAPPPGVVAKPDGADLDATQRDERRSLARRAKPRHDAHSPAAVTSCDATSGAGRETQRDERRSLARRAKPRHDVHPAHDGRLSPSDSTPNHDERRSPTHGSTPRRDAHLPSAATKRPAGSLAARDPEPRTGRDRPTLTKPTAPPKKRRPETDDSARSGRKGRK